MKKKLLLFLLLICIIISAFSLKEVCSRTNFSADKDIETISYLSSDHFKGRAPGTLENTETAAYIKTQFENLGLEPFDGDSYYHPFEAIYPKQIDGEPCLCIYDTNNNLVKKYTYGTDYVEGNCNYLVNENDFTGKDSIGYKSPEVLYLASDKGNTLFTSHENDDLNFRSSFYSSGRYNMAVILTSTVLEEIKNYINDGNTVHVFMPYKNATTTLSNVVGMIKGSDSSLPPAVISGHFDHIGTRYDNVVYNGALDNASGTAFMLELARYMKSLGTPKRDIVFIGFNGEDSCLLGSMDFANQYASKLKDADIFNFDMIGSDEGIPLCIMDGYKGSQSDKLVTEATSICKENNILYNQSFEDSSDHAPFNNLGINAITFCDDDRTRIHTPDDKVEFIKPSAINRCFTVMELEIKSFGFSKYYIAKWCTPVFIISSIVGAGILIIIIIGFKKSKTVSK